MSKELFGWAILPEGFVPKDTGADGLTLMSLDTEAQAIDTAKQKAQANNRAFVVLRPVCIVRPVITVETIEPRQRRTRRKPDSPAKAEDGKGATIAGGDCTDDHVASRADGEPVPPQFLLKGGAAA